MERAGEGLAQAIAQIIREQKLSAQVGVVAGKGNNGGDGFAAAVSLAKLGTKSRILVLYPEKDLSQDARHFYQKAKTDKAIEIIAAPTIALLRKHAARIADVSVLVDTILGTGFHGSPTGIVNEAIDLINAFTGCVVAADVPSGLDASTGKAEKAVKADVTATMGFCKSGFLLEQAMNFVGALQVVDIGIPKELSDTVQSTFHLLDQNMISELLPRRARISHKGTYGHVLIIGGSVGMTGAAILSARAALRAGSGLVTIACPSQVQPIIAEGCVEAMTLPIPENKNPSFLLNKIQSGNYRAIVLGPGIGRSPSVQKQVVHLLQAVTLPLVVDADALYAMAEQKINLKKIKSKNVILTPHVGEFARLLHKDQDSFKKSLWGEVAKYNLNSGVIVVLKSNITGISDSNNGVLFSTLGNPGMATAGMGDVLSGAIGSFLGQGLQALDAACAGVYIHGAAGDIAAKKKGFYGLIASDVIESLPKAIAQIPLHRDRSA